MRRLLTWLPFVIGTVVILVLGACTEQPAPTTPTNPSIKDPVVQMIPDPTNIATSKFAGFASLDDAYAEVAFTRGFTFPFYGTNYTKLYINTNGGVTFGAGSMAYFTAVESIAQPGIGILWGDLDPSQGDPANPDQINYQQFDDHFVITYTEVAEHVDPTKLNSMTLTLYASGKVTMSYDRQDTNHCILAVFDGSATGYVYSPNPVVVQPSYDSYASGTGTIVYDTDGIVGTQPSAHTLEGMTVTFNP